MQSAEIPLHILKNFHQHAAARGDMPIPQEWVAQFVDFGLMYWQDEGRAELTGLGEEILEEDRYVRERGIWEPFVVSGNSPPAGAQPL